MVWLSGSRIEIIHERVARGHIRHALFDFDGTLSLIREGWQQVMAPLMLEILSGAPCHEQETILAAVVQEYIDRTTGIQTIYQMMGLADMVRERGGEPLEPGAYKAEYLTRLWHHIAHRVQGIKSGTLAREAFLLPGAEAFLGALRRHDIACYLASGTDVAFVRDEATALGLTHYFRAIHGALDNLEAYSKAQVIADILSAHGLKGNALVTFGDGFVEIENTVAAGGLAVGVASDERNPGGVDAWKRERLIRAGAQLIIPDFMEWPILLDYLMGA